MGSTSTAAAAHHPYGQRLQLIVPAAQQAVAVEAAGIDDADLFTGPALHPKVGLVLDQIAEGVEASVGGHAPGVRRVERFVNIGAARLLWMVSHPIS